MSQSQPRLVMVIEPEKKVRFRYDSEKNSHGGIIGKGRSEDGKTKLYPTVKLENYNGKKKVYIRVSLCTLDKERHAPLNMLELKGKDTKNGKFKDGMYYQDLDNDFTATFKSVAIMSKKQNAIVEILMQQKKKESGRGAANLEEFEKKHKPEIKEKARKIMHSVILCFEAFTKDNSAICDPLYSDRIDNQKCAATGNFKIHYVSHYAGTCEGGERIILLCDKVKKDQVKVLFYEMNDDDEVQWEEYAEIKDVHCQTGIVLLTPKYENNIKHEVNICLVREGERSNSVQYCYIPNDNSLFNPSKKRKRDIDLESSIHSPHQSYNGETPSPSSSNDTLFETFVEKQDNINVNNLQYPLHLNLNDIFQQECSESLYSTCSAMANNNSGGILDLEQILNILPNKDAQPVQSVDAQQDIDMPFDEECADILQLGEIFGNELNDQRVNPEYRMFSLLDETCGDYMTDGATDEIKNQSASSDIDVHITLTSRPSTVMLPENQHKNSVPPSIYADGHMGAALEKCMSNLNLKDRDVAPIERSMIKCNTQDKTLNALTDKLKGKCSKLVSKRDKFNNTFLHVAVYQKKNVAKVLEISKIAGCDIVNVKNNNSKTALHIATEGDDFWNLHLLLKHGGDPYLEDQKGNTCLHIAARNDYIGCMTEIINFRPQDINVFNYEGLTPLHVSVVRGSIECLKLLLKYADVNAKDKRSGRSALHYAIDMKSPFLLPFLLDCHDVDVNIQDFVGNTPLHIASASGQKENVIELLKSGANPTIRNFKRNSDEDSEDEELENVDVDDNDNDAGETAADVAANLEIKGILQTAIEKISSRSGDTEDASPEGKLCRLLDQGKYKNLAECAGMDKSVIESLHKLHSSPTQAILKILKEEHGTYYISNLKLFLEMADLPDALQMIKDKQY